ncbi:anti-phage-associated DUF1156 domain-containing protein [Intestinibacter bartlettii]|uniref:anti-phage-associated DUF1156 domain-containing protein n=1 Tax=Intestinibacter bartlettii TaxID=261299 RepID=UPI003AB415AB
MGDKSFIEVQFPVSKISKESYKERKAGGNQTLTGLGKWWGRKPLILVRAIVIASLMPCTNNKNKDMEIFLKILSMDESGLELRKNKTITIKELLVNSTDEEKEYFFVCENNQYLPRYKNKITKKDKDRFQMIIFNRLSYDEKLKYCLRPEELDNIRQSDWIDINTHLGTNANNIRTLVKELGLKKFNRHVRLGDCFSGGGSIPFEAARIGCNIYASDLNPLAGLLTWSSLNILSKSDEEINKLKYFQESVFDQVAEQIEDWGIENNEYGWKAKYYLYCTETVCPECGCKVPLAPTWVVSNSYKTIAKLKYNKKNHNFDIIIENGASKEDIKNAKLAGTIKSGSLHCPYCKKHTHIASLRKDKKDENGKITYGLRKWDKSEFFPSKEDIFQDRLYAIKYIEKFDNKSWSDILKKPAPATDACYGNIHYIAPTEFDLNREAQVKKLLSEKFETWQKKGYIPNSKIVEGDKTDEPIRTRGWAYWHQLFNPRQLLLHGLILEKAQELSKGISESILSLLGINRCCNSNSKLVIWDNMYDKGAITFTNQALNTFYNYPVRTMSTLFTTWIFQLNNYEFECNNDIRLIDARNVEDECDIWITDPPYADAINYHELSEYFLAWDKKILENNFNDWYTDSKRALAIKGSGKEFNKSMIDIYYNLTKKMPENGIQIVMFTHSDVKVWSELAMILWSSGLQVTAAWNIATETESGGLKDSGNYVKGTVILVLRKQNSDETVYLDELYPEIEDEVKSQIDTMRDLDDKEDPNFTDADYLLAAYAASLKVLTSYKNIEDIDVQYELSKSDGESPIVDIINDAVKIAFDYLTPNGFDSYTWKTLLPEERFYIKGLDTEKNNVYKLSAYQELGRGFGVNEYSDMMESTKANKARLKTASEFAMKYTNDNTKFGHSILRNILIALYKSTKEEDATRGKAWLRNEVNDYWNERSKIIEILDYIATLEYIENMKHWEKDAKSAKILVELVRNDGV